jgi:hypothetical protein
MAGAWFWFFWKSNGVAFLDDLCRIPACASRLGRRRRHADDADDETVAVTVEGDLSRRSGDASRPAPRLGIVRSAPPHGSGIIRSRSSARWRSHRAGGQAHRTPASSRQRPDRSTPTATSRRHSVTLLFTRLTDWANAVSAACSRDETHTFASARPRELMSLLAAIEIGGSRRGLSVGTAEPELQQTG